MTKRKPNWTEEEFELLLNNNQMSDEELAEKLPLRSHGEVNIVREGIHAYHRGLNVSMLSMLMVCRLDASEGLNCPICGSPAKQQSLCRSD